MSNSVPPDVASFYDPATSTLSHLVTAPGQVEAVIIDPVLDFDPKSGAVGVQSAYRILDLVTARSLRVTWILETHAHADHLTAALWLKRQLGGGPRVAIGRGIVSVQQTFRDLLRLGADFPVDGRQFDHLFDDGERFDVGSLSFRVMATPGHTKDSVTYLVGDAAFIGDTLFTPDFGTARCDFPGGDARALYASIRQLLALAGNTRLFLCHDYPKEGRRPICETTPLAQLVANIHVREGVSEAEFVALRTARDATLAKPVLLWPSLQVNIRAGALPEPDASGARFLKIPLTGSVDWA